MNEHKRSESEGAYLGTYLWKITLGPSLVARAHHTYNVFPSLSTFAEIAPKSGPRISTTR